ncbi:MULTISPECIES: hypothetical protein [Clostridium]|uniref:hypothetical protein n=1 Tax=Clostridium TaxID=1485 RepID=UPI000825CB56|nr:MULTISPECIES: hypothetical protein [Clostridium]PJI09326.1 hypothetical protein CUB90_16215 [Clostridium sp. CT7]
MKLNNLLQESKINWSNFFVSSDSRSYDDEDKFDISPTEFLDFAKKDYYCTNKQGMINALSNAKRAIDCQVDWILEYLGYKYSEFNSKVYPNIDIIINEYELENEFLYDTPFKLKFVQAMDIAPSFLVSKIRLLRNKLEHEYTIPKKNEVKEALEVAELFINATKNIVYSEICHEFYFSNNESIYDSLQSAKEYYYVNFDVCDKKDITIMLFTSQKRLSEIITPTDEEYAFLIKVMTSHNFCYLPKAFGKEINKKYIKYSASLMAKRITFP